MKVGILGSGNVAKVLAAGFIAHAHEVMVGTRTPAKLADWAKQNQKSQLGTFAEAGKFGELLVLAVKGSAAQDVLRAVNTTNLADKTVIDVTNPIADVQPT